MSRSPDYEVESAAAPMLPEAIDRLELALIPVCPDPVPTHAAAQQAHARGCLGVGDEFDWLLASIHDTPAPRSRQTRH